MKTLSKLMLITMVAIMLVTVALPVLAIPQNPGSAIDTSVNTDTTGMSKFAGTIVNVLTTAGMIVSVIILMVLGIKYMMGSPEEKAEYKKVLVPYIVGAALVFGALAIANFIFDMLNQTPIV